MRDVSSRVKMCPLDADATASASRSSVVLQHRWAAPECRRAKANTGTRKLGGVKVRGNACLHAFAYLPIQTGGE